MNLEENSDLPGFDLISKGMDDLAQGFFQSGEALLVAIGSPRLKELGFKLPYNFPELPEHDLYALLGEEFGNSAHSQYNALIRRLVSFERALTQRLMKE